MKYSNQAVFENAFDFLEKSLDEFKRSPKYSVLHFAIAVEILLKARLIIEDWSLVVLKNANKAKYIKGDFVSVNLYEAVKRLRNIVGGNITEAEYRAFQKLSRHRNKVIHFYHSEITSDWKSEELQQILKEQCECWYYLKNLFTKKWRTHFEAQVFLFESLDEKMKHHWEYLYEIFDQKKGALTEQRNKGKKIDNCFYCAFDAVLYEYSNSVLSTGVCAVCGCINSIIKIKCECGASLTLINEGYRYCDYCHKTYNSSTDIVELFTALGPDQNVPINCQNCGGNKTVVAIDEKYFCTSCFEPCAL